MNVSCGGLILAVFRLRVVSGFVDYQKYDIVHHHRRISMDLQTCMEQRRSVRKYTNKPVPRELIREMIQAAILAPSWKNSQVSRYYVAEGNAEKELAQCLADFN